MNKRSYRQNCALAHASDILGERWTLLIFRELLIQPCRFKELNQALHGMGTNLLTARLKELEAAGLVEREYPQNRRSPYQLTEKGREVEPVILALIRWGFRYGSDDSRYAHLHHWDLLAMRALYNPGVIKNPVIVQFDSEDLRAWVCADQMDLKFGFGLHPRPDVTVPYTIAEFRLAVEQGQFASNEPVKKLLDCFPL